MNSSVYRRYREENRPWRQAKELSPGPAIRLEPFWKVRDRRGGAPRELCVIPLPIRSLDLHSLWIPLAAS